MPYISIQVNESIAKLATLIVEKVQLNKILKIKCNTCIIL